MNAEPAVQLRLLDLQAIDTTVAQLIHRRSALPEIAAVAAATERLAVLHGDAVGLETELSDIASEQRRLENDIDVVRTREERDQQRLSAGGLPGKELESLQHELESLARRQASLEDSTLEVMEQREDLETRLKVVQREQHEVAAAQESAARVRDAAWVDIDDQVAKKKGDRSAVAASITADLLALYEKVREAQGGVGAARLRQRRCEGCRLELAGSELGAARAAAPDEVLRCENCRRILVRTGESGL